MYYHALTLHLSALSHVLMRTLNETTPPRRQSTSEKAVVRKDSATDKTLYSTAAVLFELDWVLTIAFINVASFCGDV